MKKIKKIKRGKPLSKAGPKEAPVKPIKKIKRVEPPKPLKKIKKPEPAPVLPKSGPVPVVPPKFKWNGKKDPYAKKKGVPYLHVLPENMPDSFPKPHRLMVPGTAWRVDSKTNQVACMVTRMPDGVYVAWDNCTICQNHVTRCICKLGFIHPRSVEWIYIRALMSVDGVSGAASDTKHIDSTHFEVTSRALHWYKGKETGRVPTGEAPRRPVAGAAAPRPIQAPTRPAEPARKPVRKSLKKAAAAPTQVDDFNFDLSKTNADAADIADVITEQVTKSLSKPTKKTLKKVRK